jgi:hypothetical protein
LSSFPPALAAQGVLYEKVAVLFVEDWRSIDAPGSVGRRSGSHSVHDTLNCRILETRGSTTTDLYCSSVWLVLE